MATETIPAELLPCPFCGSGVVSVEGTMSSSYGWCRQCKTSGPVIWHGGPTYDRKTLNRGEAEAIAAWNRRAARPAIDAETAEACAKLGDEEAERCDRIDDAQPDDLFVARGDGARAVAAAIRALLSPASQGDDTAGRKG